MNTSYSALARAFSQFILSSSGWRKVFALSGNEEDRLPEISVENADSVFLAALSFSEFLQKEYPHITKIVVGTDSRPTGAAIQKQILSAFCTTEHRDGLIAIGIAAAPEIMSYARSLEAAFVYISASHNPIGHNGLKFGLNTGGVLDGAQTARLIALFTEKCGKTESHAAVDALRKKADSAVLGAVKAEEAARKQESLSVYRAFLREVISGSQNTDEQNGVFSLIRSECEAMAQTGKPFTIVADFNGSARAASVDRRFFEEQGMQLVGLSEEAGAITHGIVPEGVNLQSCIAAMEELHRKAPEKTGNALFGYMPDCDGDRGIIIYWDERQKRALPLDAQQVFALAVIAELSALHYKGAGETPLAIAVNGPTSLRINEIAAALNTRVSAAEVGEANVVNCAHELRKQGYTVRILGEGSNGGNITYPAAVRDPLNTLFAIIKMLLIKDTPEKSCPFRIWCEKSGQQDKYRADFTLTDIIATLPLYCTTSTQEQRALMKIQSTDHAALKRAYQQIFNKELIEKQEQLKNRFGIHSWKAFSYNGTVCTENIEDFGLSGRGGLKIQFYTEADEPVGFIWMRGSGTEPVFRIIADIKGSDENAELFLVRWQSSMVEKSDATSAQEHTNTI